MIEKTLDRAFKNAKTLTINKNSKLVLFSDVHKGDNSYADDCCILRVLEHHCW
jgi:hypothetical protein